jgi:hypothetical protein
MTRIKKRDSVLQKLRGGEHWVEVFARESNHRRNVITFTPRPQRLSLKERIKAKANALFRRAA